MKHPALLLAAFSLASVAHAGSPIFKQTQEVEALREVEYRVRTASVYTFEGEFSDSRLEDQDAVEVQVGLEVAIPLGGEWNLLLGGAYERFDFSGGADFLPEELQGVSGLIGLELIRDGRRGVYITARPGVYAAGDLEHGAFDVPIILAAGYRVTDSFSVVGGVSVSFIRQYPVLPIVGAIWRISDDLTLDLTLPAPQLVIELSETVELGVGGRITGGSYRMDPDAGKFGGSDVDYYELRAGGELRVKPGGTWTVSVEAGWSLRRNFEFDEPSRDYHTGGAPYAGLRLSAVF
jgi:hypothetical protein